uniref:Selenoprotein S n=1 Tax=Sparus aurata TaxID=8175 RepID=A0A671UA72_SPAAU
MNMSNNNVYKTCVSPSVGEILSQYGWYMLVLTVLVYLLIQYLSKKRSSQSPPPQTEQGQHQCLPISVDIPRANLHNVEVQARSRKRMQEELDAKAAIFREHQREQEEEKRRQKIEIWESMQLGKSYKGAAKASRVSLIMYNQLAAFCSLCVSDYNPLNGQGGGTCSWRPGRRGPSSGG